MAAQAAHAIREISMKTIAIYPFNACAIGTFPQKLVRAHVLHPTAVLALGQSNNAGGCDVC